MRILVTGGAGYIGSHVVRQLCEQDHDVTVLDRLSTGHREAVDTRASFILGSTNDDLRVREILREGKIEGVMHFAADIEVGESVENPAKYYRNNFTNTLSLLEAMLEESVKRFVFSSTAAVYGNPSQIPISEDHPRQPINPYGRSKMMVEMALEDFAKAYGFGYTILRYFNVAGASPDARIGEDHKPESHLIPRILFAARDQGTAKVFGTDYPTPDGTCVRDYIHVEDLAAAHILAIQAMREGEGRIFNLGSEHGFSVREVLKACEEVTGRPLQVQETARRPGDPAVLVASSQKIRSELGWERQYPELETIVQHAWNWHLRHPNGYEKMFTENARPFPV